MNLMLMRLTYMPTAWSAPLFLWIILLRVPGA